MKSRHSGRRSMPSFGEIARALISFTRSESKGLLLMLPLLIVIGVLINTLNRTPIEKSFPLLVDSITDSINGNINGNGSTHSRHNSDLTENRPDDNQNDKSTQVQLFKFDPNTIDYRGLRRLGFSQQSAAALINYRTKYNKVFELPTDFAACYQVTDSIFDRLEPYVAIGAQFSRKMPATKASQNSTQNTAPHSTQNPSGSAITLFSFDPNTLDSAGFRGLGFSARQTQTIINYRTMKSGFRSIEEFGECYGVGNRLDELRPYIKIVTPKPTIPTKVEINSAEIEDLIKVRGIGTITAQRIIDYRQRLGGFFDIRQLSEVEGVTENNFEQFSKEISVNISGITKIDVNFAPAEIMITHPYMSGIIIRKVLKYKQLKGGLSSIEEMIKGKILSDAEAEKLSHYLIFTPFTPN